MILPYSKSGAIRRKIFQAGVEIGQKGAFCKGLGERNVSQIESLIKIIAVLVAAIVIGNWFLAEVKKARLERKPWYQPYLSIPGILIMLALLLPILYWIIQQ